MKQKKKSMIATMRENSKADKDRFARSITEGKDYENLYDIGSSMKRIDSMNLLIGISGVLFGLLLFVISVLYPFIMGKGFHLGTGAAIGMMLLLSGLCYYIGAYRILHPLSIAVAVEKDHVIRGILKERLVVYEPNVRKNEEDSEKDL